VFVDGRISPLLELGAGFHPDLTGTENVYLNAALFGLSRSETEARLKDIVEFSELNDFIDVPLKHYSTGMYARLGFAVAVHVDAAILLVDEVLAVGDEAFQRKCLAKMEEFQKEGHTIIFVSHSLPIVLKLCDRALWLDHGRVKAIGATADVVERYLESVATAA
jgi:ABC-2 type transport system ATP-binding protein